MPKPYTLISIFCLSFALSIIFTTPLSAAIDPSFSFSLSNPQPGSASDIILDFNFPGGTDIPTRIDIGIPTGFELSPSSSFPGYTVVGQGNLSAYISGHYYNGFITLYNADEPEGIRWNMYLTLPDLHLERGFDIQVTGNSQQGYTFSLPDLASLGLTAPSSWHLTIFGDEYQGDGVAPYVITNPKSEGIYSWLSRFHQANGEVLERQIEVGIGKVVAAPSESKSKVPTPKPPEKKATASAIPQTPSPTETISSPTPEEEKDKRSIKKLFPMDKKIIFFLGLAWVTLWVVAIFRLVQIRKKK